MVSSQAPVIELAWVKCRPFGVSFTNILLRITLKTSQSLFIYNEFLLHYWGAINTKEEEVARFLALSSILIKIIFK